MHHGVAMTCLRSAALILVTRFELHEQNRSGTSDKPASRPACNVDVDSTVATAGHGIEQQVENSSVLTWNIKLRRQDSTFVIRVEHPVRQLDVIMRDWFVGESTEQVVDAV